MKYGRDERGVHRDRDPPSEFGLTVRYRSAGYRGQKDGTKQGAFFKQKTKGINRSIGECRDG